MKLLDPKVSGSAVIVKPFEGFNKDRGFSVFDMQNADREMSGESRDPYYEDQYKNR